VQAKLEPYPEARTALAALTDYRLAIPSNGSPDMLHVWFTTAGLVLHAELINSLTIGPLTMFKTLRTQAEQLYYEPDFVVHTLSELPLLAANGFLRS